MQALESIRNLSKHKDSSWLYFGHIWLMHFGCASGFLGLCHTFFGWRSTLRCGAYWWFASLGKWLGYFGHFVLMCNSSTFLCHMDKPPSSFLFFLTDFNKKVMQVSWESFQGPLARCHAWLLISFGGISLFFNGGLCPICFFNELGSGGFIFVLKVSYFQ